MTDTDDQYFLVVDDFSTMRRIVTGLLKELEFTKIVEAEDGSAAMKILESGTVPATFILTDWDMPVMNGLELVKKIRGTPSLAHLPILMITTEAKRENVTEAAEAGVDGYIVKPFNAATLKNKIEKILARRANTAR